MAQQAVLKNDDASRAKIWDLIKDIHIAQLVTQDSAGRLYARPMGIVQKDFDGKLWFFTTKGEPKISEIKQNPHVLVSFSNPDEQNYVSINGTARITDDQAKINELWTEYLRTWFPKGKDDSSIALICVDVEEAEYWDAPSSTFLHAYGYVKAVLTGEQPKAGENKKVSF